MIMLRRSLTLIVVFIGNPQRDLLKSLKQAAERFGIEVVEK